MAHLFRIVAVATAVTMLTVGTVAAAVSPGSQFDDGESMSGTVGQAIASLESLTASLESIQVPAGLGDVTITAEVKGTVEGDGSATDSWPAALGTLSVTVRLNASVMEDGTSTLDVEATLRCIGAADLEVATCQAWGSVASEEPGISCKDIRDGVKCTYVANDQT